MIMMEWLLVMIAVVGELLAVPSVTWDFILQWGGWRLWRDCTKSSSFMSSFWSVNMIGHEAEVKRLEGETEKKWEEPQRRARDAGCRVRAVLQIKQLNVQVA